MEPGGSRCYKPDTAECKLGRLWLGVLIDGASYRLSRWEYSEVDDNVKPDQDPDTPAAGLESVDLLAIAAGAGAGITDRMLETFRAQGLIPRPRRAGYRGRSPVWRYSPGTDQQLLALLGWREHTKDPDVLQVLLWIDGFPIPAAAVRGALTRQLRSVVDAVGQEIGRRARDLGLDPSDDTGRGPAIDVLARTMAGKRGPTPLVRRSRMRASDRARGVALLLRVFGFGETIDGTVDDAALIENVLGIAPNGRRHSIDGQEPWLTGPAEDLFDAAGIVASPGWPRWSPAPPTQNWARPGRRSSRCSSTCPS